MRRHVILGLMAVVSLSVSIWQEYHLQSAAANVEFIPNSLTNQGFTHPHLLHSVKGHEGAVKSLTFSPNSKFFVSGGSENDGIILFWNPTTGKQLASIGKAHKTSVES